MSISKEAAKTLTMGEHVLQLEDSDDFGEFFVNKARLELRETPENVASGLAQLRKLLADEEDLVIPIEDDKFLLPFLRVCKFYPESAHQKLTQAYRFKEKHPKYCRDLNPNEEVNVFNHNILTILPYRDQHGRRILLIEAGKKWDPKKVTIIEIIRGIMMLVEAALLEPKTQIAGADVLIDLEGLSLSHVWVFTPNLARLILEYVQESLPCRVKSVHIVNQPYIFNMLFAIFKPFIGEKLRNRIFFHGSNKSALSEHIDPKVLPTQYGGTIVLKTIYGPEFRKILCQHEDEIEAINRRGYIRKNGTNEKR